jgi:beta-glucanase (GH16 family)
MKSHLTRRAVGGLQEAFWLWPDDRYSTGMWPAAGEIDIAELYSRYSSYVIPYLHYGWSGPKSGVNTAMCPAERGTYNTYTLTWTPDRLEIEVNGNSCLVNTSGDQAFQKPYIVAFTQALGVGANRLRWNTPMPATLAVDYIRVWR